MDPSAFDTLARSHAAGSTRRRLVPLLAAFPLGGMLTTLSEKEVAAEHPNQRLGRRTRQRNRKHRNKRRHNNNSGGGGGGGGDRTPDPCEVSSDCPPNTLCNGGACQACDVCQKGCAFNNLHAAIDSPTRPSTIRICPGTYDPVNIQRSLTLIGAGDDDDDSSTILQWQAGFTSVVTITPANAVVTLQGLLITGGNSPEGGGIINNGALTLIDVTVSGNTATSGGGIYNAGSGVTLAGCSVTGNTASDGGGIYSGGGPVTLRNGTSVSGNSSDNCGGPGPYAG